MTFCGMDSGIRDCVLDLIDSHVAEYDRARVVRLAERGLEEGTGFAVPAVAADATEGECVVIEVRADPESSVFRVGWWHHPDVDDLHHTTIYLVCQGVYPASSYGISDADGLFLEPEPLSPDEEKMLNDLNEVAYEAAVERRSQTRK